jgi:hypothetical protein
MQQMCIIIVDASAPGRLALIEVAMPRPETDEALVHDLVQRALNSSTHCGSLYSARTLGAICGFFVGSAQLAQPHMSGPHDCQASHRRRDNLLAERYHAIDGELWRAVAPEQEAPGILATCGASTPVATPARLPAYGQSPVACSGYW